MTSKLATLLTINAATAALVAVLVVQPSFLFKNGTADAASSAYTSKWEMTKCRTFGASYDVNIGPAEWKVTYSLPSGQKIVETWTASGWDDTARQTGYSYKTQDITSTGCKTYAAPNNVIIRTGEYGYTLNPGNQNNSYNGFGHSFPVGWNVTGATQ